MTSDKNILVAFLLNALFAIVELIGGVLTGSVAIFSDAIHDLGDAVAIGIAYGLERKSKQEPDDTYSYGYQRYSILGSIITTVILLVGSSLVIYHATERLWHPVPVQYNGMILLAIMGLSVNVIASMKTRKGDSLNQKAVNLHMLEDVLGWGIVLIGALIMRVTHFYWLDAVMSIGVSVFIFYNAYRNFVQSLDIFLEKVPTGLSISDVTACLKEIKALDSVHHVHIWSLDGQHHYATLHAVTDSPSIALKEAIRKQVAKQGISHVTIEFEGSSEDCVQKVCATDREELFLAGHHHAH